MKYCWIKIINDKRDSQLPSSPLDSLRIHFYLLTTFRLLMIVPGNFLLSDMTRSSDRRRNRTFELLRLFFAHRFFSSFKLNKQKKLQFPVRASCESLLHTNLLTSTLDSNSARHHPTYTTLLVSTQVFWAGSESLQLLNRVEWVIQTRSRYS